MTAGGAAISVISPEDLVVTKILAGRPKDIEDVKAVLRHQGSSFDLGSARRLLRELELALDRSDLADMLDRLGGHR